MTSRVRHAVAALLVLAFALACASGAAADGVTNLHDDQRTGWYPDQPALTKGLVTGPNFGQIFSTNVTGQVYAQPLVSNGRVLIVTEENWVYALDPVTGAIQWQRRLGPPFDATAPPISCGDMRPHTGITSTPVIDPANGGTAYMTSKRGPGDARFANGQWVMHAISMTDGTERPGFPVAIGGTAQNAPGVSFDPKVHLQRPGLLLMNGVVYAGFGAHCDYGDFRGWVFGVSTSGQIKARWTTEPLQNHGAGIWQAGTGLASDAPGRMFVVSGNGYGTDSTPPRPTAGNTPPAQLSESIVSLRLQSDGSLKATDFFEPFDAALLDQYDSDFASGGPVVLPDSYGTATDPHLVSVVGKQGRLYTLNRDDLGGFQQASDGGNKVVDDSAEPGPVWGHPSLYGGDGGWMYIAASSGGPADRGNLAFYRRGVTNGRTQMVLCARTSPDDVVSNGSSSPVITSDGTTDGSALVWAVTMSWRDGLGAKLSVYDAQPQCGSSPMPLRSWSVGVGTRYAPPGVYDGRLYVGTLDGHVLGYGSPTQTPLTASHTDLGDATTAAPTSGTVTLTSQQDGLSISALSIDSGSGFSLASTPTLPVTLDKGQTLDVPVRFAPTSPGLKGAPLRVTSSAGPVLISLSGRARAASAYLQTVPALISLGGVAAGTTASGTATFTNAGAKPLHVTGVSLPASPVTVTGLPAAPFTLLPDDSITATVRFPASGNGDYASELGLSTDGSEPEDNRVVGITARSVSPPALSYFPTTIGFGPVVKGTSATRTIRLRNTGGAALTLTKVKSPTGDFSLVGGIDEGTVIQGGASVTATFRFTPTALGARSATLTLNADDGKGVRLVPLRGNGVATAPSPTPTTPTHPIPPPTSATATTPPPASTAPAATTPASTAPAAAPVLPSATAGPLTPIASPPSSSSGHARHPRPRLTLLALKPSRTGSDRVSFHLTTAARVRLTVRRGTRQVGPATSVDARAGTVHVKLRVRLRRLTPGRYTLVATPRSGSAVRLRIVVG